MTARRRWAVVLTAVALVTLASVSLGSPERPAMAASTDMYAAPRTTLARTPQQALASMTLAQRVGELLMMGNPASGASSVTAAYVRRYHVGSVILTGRSSAGVNPTAATVHRLKSYAGAASTGGTRLLVATDQEGGNVQVLRGPGFGTMPSALYQGTHWSTDKIRANAIGWGLQLRRAGVNLDLAPVLDTVSASFAPYNPPIGHYDREYGHTAAEVFGRGHAFAVGMRTAREGITIKHFPGLGFVRGNTDTTAGVTDGITTRHYGSLAPFAAQIRAGTDAVMISTVTYTKLAPAPATFSSLVMRTMLRGDLGFTGAIVSDDLGSARQVQAWGPGERAVLFVMRGGDLVLTVDPATIPSMYSTLYATAVRSPAFRAQVDAAALHVLELKSRLGLLG